MKYFAALFLYLLMLLVPATWDASSGTWAPVALLYFIDIPVMLYVLFPALAVTLVVHPWSDLMTGVSVAVGQAPEAEREEIIRGARAVRFLGRMGWITGLLVALVQGIISAHNSVSILMLMPALGVSALGLVYGLALLIVCKIAVQIAKCRLGDFVFYGE